MTFHPTHRPSHGIAVGLALAASLLTLSPVHAQSTNAAAVFEGRPAMAGAQGGLGAQSGQAQGGVGVQGTDASQRSIQLRRSSTLGDSMTLGTPPPHSAATDVVAANNVDMTLKSDPGLAKDSRGTAKKSKRAVKRTAERAKHGVSSPDTTLMGAPASGSDTTKP